MCAAPRRAPELAVSNGPRTYRDGGPRRQGKSGVATLPAAHGSSDHRNDVFPAETGDNAASPAPDALIVALGAAKRYARRRPSGRIGIVAWTAVRSAIGLAAAGAIGRRLRGSRFATLRPRAGWMPAIRVTLGRHADRQGRLGHRHRRQTSTPRPPAARPPGLLRVFASGQGSGASRGYVDQRQAGAGELCRQHHLRQEDRRNPHDARHGRREGLRDRAAEPPPIPERIPVTDAHRRGVIDPMTGSLIRVPGNGNPLGAAGLPAHAVGVRRPHALRPASSPTSAWTRSRPRRAMRARWWSARSISRRSPATFPTRAAIKYLVEQRDMEVWLAPVAGTRVLVPFRVVDSDADRHGRDGGDAVRLGRAAARRRSRPVAKTQ